MVVDPIDYKGYAYKNLPQRLEAQARNVEKDGWLNAARLMRNASDVLLDLQERGVIKLEIDDERFF
jgi:hypothetical protein